MQKTENERVPSTPTELYGVVIWNCETVCSGKLCLRLIHALECTQDRLYRTSDAPGGYEQTSARIYGCNSDSASLQ